MKEKRALFSVLKKVGSLVLIMINRVLKCVCGEIQNLFPKFHRSSRATDEKVVVGIAPFISDNNESRELELNQKVAHLIGTLKDLVQTTQLTENGLLEVGNRLEGLCRRMRLLGESLEIDFIVDQTGYIPFPLDTKVFFESWDLDKGSLVFRNNSDNCFPRGEWIKLACEYDFVINKIKIQGLDTH